jgi:anthraniloyl-CoA monooxygenase
MNVNVLGGGPAGLYASVLLKKAHPGWEIRVYERNPRGATYGWGVVFSDRTLTSLREADVKTFTEITDSFVLWEAIDAYIWGELQRCDGHAFAGIGRRQLLDILWRRCVELGVEVRFEVEVDDPELLRDADVLIAADGVNSRTRNRYADSFQPRVSEGRARFIWFGSDKVYDAFTFVFRDTEHGLFQVHAYPFDATTSTFIVECHEDVWRRAGLDHLDEAASLAHCQELFADHLGSHRLMSNRSLWLTFQTLSCRHWTHNPPAGSGQAPVVLLGDAAHTAHFSIGSGTKLALEDAIALARAFEEHPQVTVALRQYELGRRARVEATQRAAAESQRYFESIRRYRGFEPPQFAFHLLTRSGRITYDNLKQRDPYFVANVERWYQGRGCGDRDRLIAPPPMFVPLTLRGARLPNRTALVAPPASVAVEGTPGDDHAAVQNRLAGAGAGLVLTEPVAVSPEGRVTAGDMGIYLPEHTAAWSRIVAEAGAGSSTLLGLTLSHAGRRGATRPRAQGLDRPLRDGGWPLLAPSAIPYMPHGQMPRAMDSDDLRRVRDAYVDAACHADVAGFDLMLLDMAHGYLLGSFLSPLTNHREDAYGGSREKRMRYPLEVFDAARATWPARKPLAVVITATDWARGGARLDDAVAFARELRARGCDLLAVHAGQTTFDARPVYDFDAWAELSDVIRNESGIPTIFTGYVTTSNQANTLLAGGRCDVCVWTGVALTPVRHPEGTRPSQGRGEVGGAVASSTGGEVGGASA